MNKLKYIISILLILLLFGSANAKVRTYTCNALTGGAEGALDAIDGQNLFDGDTAIVINSAGAYFYHLDDDSGAAESSPATISPDTNAGDKRWIRVAPYAP